MQEGSKYPSCNVAGGGKLFIKPSGKEETFKIIDMSAAVIRVDTDAELEEGVTVGLKIKLNSLVFDVNIDASGRVIKRTQKEKGCEYSIEFTELSERDREEIDELMRSTCNLE